MEQKWGVFFFFCLAGRVGNAPSGPHDQSQNGSCVSSLACVRLWLRSRPERPVVSQPPPRMALPGIIPSGRLFHPPESRLRAASRTPRQPGSNDKSAGQELAADRWLQPPVLHQYSPPPSHPHPPPPPQRASLRRRRRRCYFQGRRSLTWFLIRGCSPAAVWLGRGELSGGGGAEAVLWSWVSPAQTGARR